MPRTARIVLPDVPHHVTQRGTNREPVFHSHGDRRVYLDLLHENCELGGLKVLAYCLMPNHIHLIAVPEDEIALSVVLRRTHGRYAQYFNARKQRSGHLWQNRFYSCPLERAHLWNALSYVERNPIRAGMAATPEEYEWSSAKAHLGLARAEKLLDMGYWEDLGGVVFWRDLLDRVEPEDWRKALRRATYAGKVMAAEELDGSGAPAVPAPGSL